MAHQEDENWREGGGGMGGRGGGRGWASRKINNDSQRFVL